APVDPRLGLQLAGSILLQRSGAAAEGHADRRLNLVRQLRRESAQPVYSAATGAVGHAVNRRDGWRPLPDGAGGRGGGNDAAGKPPAGGAGRAAEGGTERAGQGGGTAIRRAAGPV